jgi:hypothetical protein
MLKEKYSAKTKSKSPIDLVLNKNLKTGSNLSMKSDGNSIQMNQNALQEITLPQEKSLVNSGVRKINALYRIQPHQTLTREEYSNHLNFPFLLEA